MYNPMGNYTLEIGQIEKHGGKIFDFEYPFYYEPHRAEFERKFLLHFRYNEIGQETLQRFKYMLQDTLTYNYEKYKHHWDTKLKAGELQWWNNKDYHTELSRVLDSEGSSENRNKSNAKSDSAFASESHDTSGGTSKFSDTPQGRIENLEKDGYLTNATIDSGKNDNVSKGGSLGTSSNEGESSNTRKDKDTETIITNEYGNIGTTSSGDLVASWLRDGFIDIDRMILNDCEELFMQIY